MLPLRLLRKHICSAVAVSGTFCYTLFQVEVGDDHDAGASKKERSSASKATLGELDVPKCQCSTVS